MHVAPFVGRVQEDDGKASKRPVWHCARVDHVDHASGRLPEVERLPYLAWRRGVWQYLQKPVVFARETIGAGELFIPVVAL